MEKFVFYDYETTGISPEYDQPLQFAAIITDLDFNEIERVDIRCQISTHILTAPMAIHDTAVNPTQLLNNNLPAAFEFAQKIPPSLKMKGNETKYILKKVAERYLPKEIIYRPKTGFGAPVRKWIKEDMSDMIRERLSEERISEQGIFDQGYLF